MALFTNDGLDAKCLYLLGKTVAIGYTIRLYTNNYLPVLTSIPADFTEYPSGQGYAPLTTIPALWTGGTVLGIATYTYAQITFVFNAYVGAPRSIYGYYVTDPISTVVVFAEAAVQPFLVPFVGGQILLTPQWIDTNL
jgi:hypothetical protein